MEKFKTREIIEISGATGVSWQDNGFTLHYEGCTIALDHMEGISVTGDLPEHVVVDNDRPWGGFVQFNKLGGGNPTKFLVVLPEMRLSLQWHKLRAETWSFVFGTPMAIVNRHCVDMRTSNQVNVPLHARHRLAGGPQGGIVFETFTGKFCENDNIRIQDDHNRV